MGHPPARGGDGCRGRRGAVLCPVAGLTRKSRARRVMDSCQYAGMAVRYAGHLLGNRYGIQDVRVVAVRVRDGRYVICRGRDCRRNSWTISCQACLWQQYVLRQFKSKKYAPHSSDRDLAAAYACAPARYCCGTQKYKRFVRIKSYQGAPWDYLQKLITLASKFNPYSAQSW